jgi:hypothetical protein
MVALVSVLGGAACAANDDAGQVGNGGMGGGGSGRGPAGNAGASTGVGGAGATGAGTSSGAGSGVGGAATAGTGGGDGGVGGSGVGGDGGNGGSVAGAGAGAGAGGRSAGAGGNAGAGGKAAAGGSAGSGLEPVSLTIFEEVVFYDGYAAVADDPVPAGTLRLRNDLFTHQLTDEELGAIQSTLRVQVVIGALCDNYDRIGSVALALVPKGETTYAPDAVERVEIGRYITPFMNWNRQPDEVTYDFAADNLVPVLHDEEIRAEFDLWLELELFGVPYAANEEVAGCANRNDVFRGTLTLDSDSSAPAAVFDGLTPLAYKQPFNDYQPGASDVVGATRKTVEFVLDADSSDSQLVLVISNHGANTDGEEYVRRDHFAYVDDELVLMFKPGRTSCEPFRLVNTQANGIYGSAPRTDSTWQSFSNWCPGDVIDTRIIPLGPLGAGPHEFVIDVPDAEFVGDDGNFPFSLYLQSQGG